MKYFHIFKNISSKVQAVRKFPQNFTNILKILSQILLKFAVWVSFNEILKARINNGIFM